MKNKIVTITPNPAIDQTLFIPDFKGGNVNRVQKYYSHAGGKGINVGSLLSDFGYDVSVSGFLGEKNSIIFEDLFKRKQMDDLFIRIPGETRTGIKIVNETSEETTDINFPGALPTAKHISMLLEIVEKHAKNAEWFILAGSLPAGAPKELYKDIINIVKMHGVKTALDTSSIPLSEALKASPTLIKPNIEELQEVLNIDFKTRDEIIIAARNLINSGIKTVIVSMGADGALFVEKNEVVFAKPGEVNLLSTVGAGDAMVAGTIAGKLQKKSIEECAKLGTAFSMSALSQLTSNLPNKVILHKLLEQIMVKLV